MDTAQRAVMSNMESNTRSTTTNLAARLDKACYPEPAEMHMDEEGASIGLRRLGSEYIGTDTHRAS
jgi:hypothetical protein